MKTYVQNLGMFVTEKCNLNCEHCCRGGCSNKNVSDEVIENTIDQVDILGRLSICGGEPTLAVDRIEKLFTYIWKKGIKLESVYTFLNGSKYSEKLMDLFKAMNDYITITNQFPRNQVCCLFGISYDDFHFEALDKKGLIERYYDNVYRYMESDFYDNLIEIELPLFREGNAVNLPSSFTKPFPKIGYLLAYHTVYGDKICYIGPVLSVNVDGIVTECDASWDNQRTKYNYGNILNDSLENIVLKNNARIIDMSQWGEESSKLIKKYYS